MKIKPSLLEDDPLIYDMPLLQNNPLLQNRPLLHASIAVTQKSIEIAEQVESPTLARFGRILSLCKSDANNSSNQVIVDFEGNPFNFQLSAKLGRAFRINEIELAICNGLTCRIDFINGDINTPIVTDIFFSLLNETDELILRAKNIVIEAVEELVVRSGETQTRYSARDKRITTKAKYITSQAEKAQKIQGGTISLN